MILVKNKTLKSMPVYTLDQFFYVPQLRILIGEYDLETERNMQCGGMYIVGETKRVRFERLDHFQHDFDRMEKKLENLINMSLRGTYAFQSTGIDPRCFVFCHRPIE